MEIKKERIESLKAGIVGAVAFSCALGVVWGVNLSVAQKPLILIPLGWYGGIELAIAAATGFLFGVTYRYIIREDQNSHLQDGAVLAFTLVRTGTFLEQKARESLDFLPWAIFGVESLFCFYLTRLTLDVAIKWQWVKRLNNN